MIINDVQPEASVASELDEQFFSIQDQGMIFDILRNKMYSNPILAICREITCNARDAHREVGKSDVPISIYLPNQQEQFFKVKDYGPGISPDRMSNIFIKYTASTKRNDNIQTGGFGLGAKTPFSYSDSFNIVTTYNGTRYNYACFIDETKIGKLSLLSECSTTESNGTEIIIPIQPKDFRSFEEYTEYAVRHWKVQPIIKPYALTIRKPTEMMSGSNWSLCSSNSWSRGTRLIVDEIEYPVDFSALRSYADVSVVDAARGDVYLYFGVGELSLSASREQIYLDEATKNKINDRLKSVTQEIKDLTQEKLNNATNFFEANLYYRTALQQNFHNLGFLGRLLWQGNHLITGHPDIGCAVIAFSKGRSYNRRHNSALSNPEKISRSTHRSFLFAGEEGTNQVYINDLNIKEITNKHVKKAFEENPQLKCVQIVCPNDKTTVDTLNNNYCLDKMQPKLLSTIAKISNRAQRNGNSRLIVFKFDPKIANFKQTSYASIDEDLNNKILCLLTKSSDNSNKEIYLKSGKHFNMSYLRFLTTDKSSGSDNAEYSFYGIDSTIPESRIREEFADFMDLEEFIDNKVLNIKREEYIKAKYIYSCRNNIDNNLLQNLNAFKLQIKDSNSTFLKHVLLHETIEQFYSAPDNQERKLLHLYEDCYGFVSDNEINDWLKVNPDFNFELSQKAFETKYPLLAYIYDTYNSRNVPAAHITQYVNFMDSCN